jgi:fluoride exporter
MMMEMIYIAVGGFFGANARFIISRKVINKQGFPLGTLIVNLLGAFLLGILFGMKLNGHLYALLGVGFMGAFTTFSTFKLETEKLRGTKKLSFFYLNLALSYIVGISLAYIGLIIGKSIG